MRAGVAVRDITPDPGAAMSGFAARTRPVSGVHDRLEVRALTVADTAVVTVDVVGLDGATCARIAQECVLPAERVLVHATHTHGGPVSMQARLGGPLDRAWLDRVVRAAVEAVAEAHATATEVTVHGGYGPPCDLARNRRRPDGPVDRDVPVIRFVRRDGRVLATVVSYACHPVVLGGDNTLLTADYPGVVRRVLAEETGAPVLFLTGCAGDANNGHSPDPTAPGAPSADRTFDACEQAGADVADAADRAMPTDLDGPVRAAARRVGIELVPADAEQTERDLTAWQAQAREAEPGVRALLDEWSAWARAHLAEPRPAHLEVPVTVLRWGRAVLVGLPGEPFATAGRTVRSILAADDPDAVTVVAGYTGECFGYLPAREEYPSGGYEVCDAHRYYGMPGPAAPGSLEQLVEAAAEAWREVRDPLSR
ncbi:neutral/alkaline non-lysosomal ceramidase N-terminal domain-containing protein [Georgenia deserti]|uniref:Neutral ceramidase n=1 Tax=Georgenia deserti TaxID=2093781 RepID=A0ABW4L234_9MICO